MSPLLMNIFIGDKEGNTIVNPTVFNSVVLVLVLCVFFIICGNAVKKADPSKPSKGIVLFLEILVTGIEGLVEQTMGVKHLKFCTIHWDINSVFNLCKLIRVTRIKCTNI